jgi:hypothetical protein
MHTTTHGSTMSPGLVELRQRTRLLLQVFQARLQLRPGLTESTLALQRAQADAAQPTEPRTEGARR